MAHLYGVTTNQGDFNVTVAHHHDHISVADFERIVIQTLLNSGLGLARDIILHRYVYKGQR